MFVWVAYDISDNNLRTRIADHCKFAIRTL